MQFKLGKDSKWEVLNHFGKVMDTIQVRYNGDVLTDKDLYYGDLRTPHKLLEFEAYQRSRMLEALMESTPV